MDKQYKHLTFLAMLVLTVMFMDSILEYKPIEMPFGSMMAASFVFPFWFILTDVITEVYGPKAAKKVLWSAFACQLLLSLTAYVLIHQKSPSGWTNQDSYNLILGHLPRIVLSNFLSIILAGYININLLAKWKILMRGRYFWLRSIGSSAIAEILYSTLAVTLIGYQIFTPHQLATMIMWSYIMKLSYTTLFAAPATLLVGWLKHAEGQVDMEVKNPLAACP